MTRPATSGAREGGEKEEPKEPPLPLACCGIEVREDVSGYFRVIGGARLLALAEAELKEPYYHYNSMISSSGFYVKPVHKVYKRREGRRIVYVYYGRYWFRRVPGGRNIYAGSVKPAQVPLEPPPNPLAGVSLILDGDDLLVNREGVHRVLGILCRYC